MLSRRVLSKEEESESTDAEVSKEDQDKINTFSRLHNRRKVLEEELATKQTRKTWRNFRPSSNSPTKTNWCHIRLVTHSCT